MLFSLQRQADPFHPSVNNVLEFLLLLFKNGKADNSGLGYSALGTARSAISAIATIDGKPAGQHILVKRFMRSVFNQRPALPRYTTTWDPQIVLNYIKNLGPNRRLSLRQLTKKLTFLLLLLSGQRCQTIHQLDISGMSTTNSKVIFKVNSLLKTSRPGHHQPDLVFLAYAPDRRLCVLTTIKEYLARTIVIRGASTKLLQTTRPPFHPASRATVSRWSKEIMAEAGIDMNIFSTHSTRSASTSAVATHLPIMTIVKTIGWADSSVFAKYYQKPLSQQGMFSSVLLNNN